MGAHKDMSLETEDSFANPVDLDFRADAGLVFLALNIYGLKSAEDTTMNWNRCMIRFKKPLTQERKPGAKPKMPPAGDAHIDADVRNINASAHGCKGAFTSTSFGGILGLGEKSWGLIKEKYGEIFADSKDLSKTKMPTGEKDVLHLQELARVKIPIPRMALAVWEPGTVHCTAPAMRGIEAGSWSILPPKYSDKGQDRANILKCIETACMPDWYPSGPEKGKKTIAQRQGAPQKYINYPKQ